MSDSESYTVLYVGGLPDDVDLSLVDASSENPLYSALGEVRNRFLDNDMSAPEGGVMSIPLGFIDGGNASSLLTPILAKLREAGASYDVTDNGAWEWDPSAVYWRPGMDEPLRYPCNQDGDQVFERGIVEVILAHFPEALEAVRKVYPVVPPLEEAPRISQNFTLPG